MLVIPIKQGRMIPLHNKKNHKGGPPSPVIHGVITTIGKVATAFTRLFSAIYRGPMSLHL